jgi:hypothetical protein
VDLLKPVTYRGININDAGVVAGTSMLNGIGVDQCVFHPVGGVGYTEKKSLGDGRNSSDVFLDGRRISLAGTIYATSRSSAFDLKQELMAALTPTGAYLEDPGAYGYLPLAWYEPTADTAFVVDTDGLRYRHVYSNVRPLSTPNFIVDRDRIGGVESRGLTIPWQCQFEAIDPRIYGDEVLVYLSDVDNAAHTKNAAAQTFTNRGNYPAPLNLLMVIAANRPKPGFLKLTAGGSIMRIAIPISTHEQVFRYSGTLGVLTVEDSVTGVETLRQDLLVFLSNTTDPLIMPGSSAWSFTSVASEIGVSSVTYEDTPVAINVSTRVWFDEAYA